ncbi:MAG: hypothetical protein HRU38_25525, partial [Saccharospirillaceae bacterium]|nr:hypothetical protein [Saccharospirillaceae bacterium]
MVANTVTKPSKNENGNKSYVKVKIFDTFNYALTDSGSPVSLISKQIIPKHILSTLKSCKTNLVGAEGSSLKIVGKLNTHIFITDQKFEFESMVVDNLEETILIGSNFLVANKCVLNFSNLSLKVGSVTIPLLTIKHTNKQSTFGVYLHKTLKIPAKSVADNIQFKTKNRKTKKPIYSTFSGIFSPCDKLLAKKYAIVGTDLLVNIKKGKSYIKLENPNNYPVTVYKNQTLGTVNVVSNCCPSVNTVMENEENECENEVDNLELLFQKLDIDKLTHLNQSEVDRLKSLISKYQSIFSLSDDHIECSNLPEHDIVLDTNIPIRTPYRPIPLALKPHAEKEIQRLLDLNVIEPSQSPFHSPSFLIKKKAQGTASKGPEYRLITDYRMVNKHVIRSYQTLPSIDSITSLWNGCKYFSCLDLNHGYFQIKISAKSRPITASCIPG